MNTWSPRPNLFWPIVLIGVGVIFLLSNTGVITGNPWPIIFNLWPVLLIIAGLDLLFGRRTAAGALVGAVLGLALVGFVLWILLARPNLPGLNLSSPELKSEHVASALQDIQSAGVSIDFPSGDNQLHALGDSNNLIEGDLTYYGELEFTATDSGGRAEVRVDSSFSCFFCSFGGGERWDIGLNTRPEYALSIDLGSGGADLDLSRLKLSDSQLDIGSGSTHVVLPEADSFTLRIDGGSGSLNIRLPRALALRVEIDRGSGSFDPGSRLQRIGEPSRDNEVYETENFGSAANAATLIIDGGSGSISIEE
ncbi:MAG TPA: DUF5668 domain-containing protein [Anaerolineae bacterium]|nr:DUF5668 domain-containing protein [Anaerolineae bacterium]